MSSSTSPSKSGIDYASYLPAVWQDDERMGALMSQFRARETNPDGYDAKMRFWSDLVEHLKQPVFTHKQLVERFRRKTKIPICLKIVLMELIRKGEIQTLVDFRAGKPAKNASTTADWLLWGMDVFVARPIKWALGVGESKSEDKWTFDESSVEFVHIPALKQISSRITERYWDSRKDADPTAVPAVIKLGDLERMCRDLVVSRSVFELALIQMERDGLAKIRQSADGQKLVKFVSESADINNELDRVESEILKLRSAMQTLEAEVNGLEKQAEKAQEDARMAVRQGQRPKAMQQLKKKHLYEAQLRKKATQLDNMEAMLMKLQDLPGQRKIIDAFSTSVAAYKKHGPSISKLDDTIDQWQEVFDEQEEINAAMASASPVSFGAQGDVSEAELEAELKELLVEGEEEEEAESSNNIVVPDLPQIPEETPVPKRARVDRLAQLRAQLEDA